MKECPVCAADVPEYQFEHPNGARIRCTQCGTFRLMERPAQILGERRIYSANYAIVPDKRLSAALRQRAERGEETIVDDLASIYADYDPPGDLPTALGRVLQHIARKAPTGHRFVPLIGRRDAGVIGADDHGMFDHTLGEATKLGFVERKALDEAAYRLTMAGWQHLREFDVMERKRLLEVADRVTSALYDLELRDGYSATALADAVGLDESEIARALRYMEKQGWVTVERVFASTMPALATLTKEGLRHAEQVLNGPTAANAPQPNVVYNVSGPNARINIGSHDASVNVVDLDSNTFFAEIERVVAEAVPDRSTREDIVRAVREFRGATDPKTKAQRLGELLEVAANITTVLQPFLPALMQLVAQKQL
jgi:DNA-binding MarR family transcriptional regulator